jgi:hypothetical protein
MTIDELIYKIENEVGLDEEEWYDLIMTVRQKQRNKKTPLERRYWPPEVRWLSPQEQTKWLKEKSNERRAKSVSRARAKDTSAGIETSNHVPLRTRRARVRQESRQVQELLSQPMVTDAPDPYGMDSLDQIPPGEPPPGQTDDPTYRANLALLGGSPPPPDLE